MRFRHVSTAYHGVNGLLQLVIALAIVESLGLTTEVVLYIFTVSHTGRTSAELVVLKRLVDNGFTLFRIGKTHWAGLSESIRKMAGSV